MKFPQKLQKGVRILTGRIRKQGLRTTLVWAYGRGGSKLTGVPILRYSQITPQLYVGPQFNQKGKRHLEQQGIHYDVNLRIEFDDAAHGLALAHYCYLPTVDDDAPTLEHLQQGAEFIEQAIESGGKVYVHCAGGVGRAPTAAAAYLIRQGLTPDEALDFIGKARPFINPVPAQIEQLRRFAVLK